jgi:hypothetical protein
MFALRQKLTSSIECYGTLVGDVSLFLFDIPGRGAQAAEFNFVPRLLG